MKFESIVLTDEISALLKKSKRSGSGSQFQHSTFIAATRPGDVLQFESIQSSCTVYLEIDTDFHQIQYDYNV